MKVIAVLLLALATVSAGTLPNPKLVHPRDRTMGQSIESRIINGDSAQPGQIPYQVDCVLSNIIYDWLCGGSIISPIWILTAAHCTDGAFYAKIYLGSVILQSGTVVTVTMADFKQHPKYNSKSVNHDISLLKLDNPINFGPNIGKIGLPPLNGPPNTYEGKFATVSGWGRTSNNGTSLPSNLQFAVVKVISNSECALKYPGYITDGMVCTSVADAATCNGDSGGPLVINDETFGPIQAGIVSFGSSAGCDKFPSVYTRTSYYRPWIYTTSGV